MERHTSLVVSGQTRTGEAFKMRANGWLARIFQHEVDHLNGVIFTDRTDDIWEPEGEVIDNV
ncbi:MAG: hypothetical protein B6243_08715 [Anaerolineaceae bacterium 4572_5.2]|nr:MAG: hypothetical protein B6243_08715 [Anaerolineaceae bacterium 4572_5.2]